jgi:hypothetical protein
MPRPKKQLELATEKGKVPYVVKPELNVPGVSHILQELELPEYKAVSLVRVGKTNDWAPVLLTIKEGKVTEMIAGEPNMYQVAVDIAKINFVKEFIRPKDL